MRRLAIPIIAALGLLAGLTMIGESRSQESVKILHPEETYTTCGQVVTQKEPGQPQIEISSESRDHDCPAVLP